MKASLTAVAHGKYSAVLFGGSDWSFGEKYYRDVWALEKKAKPKWVRLSGPSRPTTEDRCSSRKDRPCARRAHTAVSMDKDSVVIFGRYCGVSKFCGSAEGNSGCYCYVGGRPANGKVLGDAWLFDLQKNRFTYIGKIPGESRERCSSCESAVDKVWDLLIVVDMYMQESIWQERDIPL